MSIQHATFAGGCFWCIESSFNLVKGVQSAISGYAGGSEQTANYKDVCSGLTDHAEVVHVTYDSDVITYETLLDMFFKLHDPTQLNRQGNDIGRQYRSAIFYHNDEQLTVAKGYLDNLMQAYDAPVVTELSQLEHFFPAEEYHQGYYNQNPHQGYCAMVVGPKVSKFKATYNDRLK